MKTNFASVHVSDTLVLNYFNYSIYVLYLPRRVQPVSDAILAIIGTSGS